jgi:alanine dehydrogenase
MARVSFRYLDRSQVRSLMPSPENIQRLIEAGLVAHGSREVVLPPKAHIELDDRYNGHFNILVGWAGPNDTAGVKVIGDFVDNYNYGLPSEVAMLTLYDPHTGVPLGLMDATDITTERTGAVTAIGAKYLTPKNPKIIGHVGARGTAFANIAKLARQFDIAEVRITSKREETREALAKRVIEDCGIRAVAVRTAEAACHGADIVVEATRLEAPEILIRDEWLQPNCLLVTYGWKMAVDPATVRSASKVVVDDWEQCCRGGQLHSMIVSGELTRETIHAEIGEIAGGTKSGRESSDGRIVFWHRGFAISDIMLGADILKSAETKNVGTSLLLFDQADE